MESVMLIPDSGRPYGTDTSQDGDEVEEARLRP